MSTTTTTVLGLRKADLSLSDLIEEIKDVRNDIAVLEDYYEGRIPASEVVRDTLFKTDDLPLLREALLTLREWRKEHLIVT